MPTARREIMGKGGGAPVYIRPPLSPIKALTLTSSRRRGQFNSPTCAVGCLPVIAGINEYNNLSTSFKLALHRKLFKLHACQHLFAPRCSIYSEKGVLHSPSRPPPPSFSAANVNRISLIRRQKCERYGSGRMEH
jgi:hypothetical protein